MSEARSTLSDIAEYVELIVSSEVEDDFLRVKRIQRLKQIQIRLGEMEPCKNVATLELKVEQELKKLGAGATSGERQDEAQSVISTDANEGMEQVNLAIAMKSKSHLYSSMSKAEMTIDVYKDHLGQFAANQWQVWGELDNAAFQIEKLSTRRPMDRKVKQCYADWHKHLMGDWESLFKRSQIATQQPVGIGTGEKAHGLPSEFSALVARLLRAKDLSYQSR